MFLGLSAIEIRFGLRAFEMRSETDAVSLITDQRNRQLDRRINPVCDTKIYSMQLISEIYLDSPVSSYEFTTQNLIETFDLSISYKARLSHTINLVSIKFHEVAEFQNNETLWNFKINVSIVNLQPFSQFSDFEISPNSFGHQQP